MSAVLEINQTYKKVEESFDVEEKDDMVGLHELVNYCINNFEDVSSRKKGETSKAIERKRLLQKSTKNEISYLLADISEIRGYYDNMRNEIKVLRPFTDRCFNNVVRSQSSSQRLEDVYKTISRRLHVLYSLLRGRTIREIEPSPAKYNEMSKQDILDTLNFIFEITE